MGFRLASGVDCVFAGFRALASEFPEIQGYRFSLSRTLHESALLERSRENHGEARALLEEAARNSASFAELKTGHPISRIKLAQLYGDLSDTLRQLGDSSLAEEYREKARQIGFDGRPSPGRGGPGFRERAAEGSRPKLGDLLPEPPAPEGP